jgi:hypothetical protein
MNTLNVKNYDEERDKLHELNGRLCNFNIFYDSWWVNKCLEYNGEQLVHHYDLFFSRYVIYNNLYNSIVSLKVFLGRLNVKTNRKQKIIERGDREKAIDCIAEHLLDSELDLLFKKEGFARIRNSLVDMIKNQFVITHWHGKQRPEDDLDILEKLQYIDRRKVLYGLLEVLYNVRCNMFHGSKNYHDSQIALLKVLNEFLFEIVTILYRSYRLLIEQEVKKANDAMDKITAEIKQSKTNLDGA